MNVVIGPTLEAAIKKLAHCKDPTTGARVFVGTIKLEFHESGSAILAEEEPNWETEEGAVINTRMLREE